MCPKKIFGQKNFESTKNVGQKILGLKNFGLKKLLEKIFSPKYFGFEEILEKYFGSEKFWFKKNVQKKFWARNKFRVRKNFGSENIWG